MRFCKPKGPATTKKKIEREGNMELLLLLLLLVAYSDETSLSQTAECLMILPWETIVVPEPAKHRISSKPPPPKAPTYYYCCFSPFPLNDLREPRMIDFALAHHQPVRQSQNNQYITPAQKNT
jgi:hypothetical protein